MHVLLPLSLFPSAAVFMISADTPTNSLVGSTSWRYSPVTICLHLSSYWKMFSPPLGRASHRSRAGSLCAVHGLVYIINEYTIPYNWQLQVEPFVFTVAYILFYYSSLILLVSIFKYICLIIQMTVGIPDVFLGSLGVPLVAHDQA